MSDNRHENTDVVDRDLWRQQPTNARSKVLGDWQGLVGHVARRVANRIPSNTVEESDLFQVGALGLFDAVEKFDPNQGTPFASYAQWRIRGAIQDYLRQIDPVPTRTRRAVSQLERGLSDLREALNREPSLEEVANHMRWTVDRVNEIGSRAAWHSAPIQECDWETEDTPESLSLNREVHEKMLRAFERLATQKRTVLKGIYLEERRGRAVATEIGVSQGRVSQIKSEALSEMKGLMESSEWS